MYYLLDSRKVRSGPGVSGGGGQKTDRRWEVGKVRRSEDLEVRSRKKWKEENGIEEAENRRWEVEKMREWEDWKREVGLLQRH
jgi:hypothetical protein